MIQLTPQMRILVAIEPTDFRRGIDGLARVCKEVLGHDPFAGWVFVFRNRARWHVELDLRSAKVHLHLDDLRCLSPEMVRREILVHWLAYNLVRQVMAQAALSQERLPRQLSFAAALAVVVGNWLQASLARQDLLRALAKAQWRLIAWQRVGDRPDRVEPRAIKRRPKSHKLLTKPRQQARADLLHSSDAHS